MCSFGSCQTRFEFLSQFRKFRNAFECFVTQVQTRLPKTKCVWPMKINVICTVRESWPRRGRARGSCPIITVASAELTGGGRGNVTEEGGTGTWGPPSSWVSVASEGDTSHSSDFYGTSE